MTGRMDHFQFATTKGDRIPSLSKWSAALVWDWVPIILLIFFRRIRQIISIIFMNIHRYSHFSETVWLAPTDPQCPCVLTMATTFICSSSIFFIIRSLLPLGINDNTFSGRFVKSKIAIGSQRHDFNFMNFHVTPHVKRITNLFFTCQEQKFTGPQLTDETSMSVWNT